MYYFVNRVDRLDNFAYLLDISLGHDNRSQRHGKIVQKMVDKNNNWKRMMVKLEFDKFKSIPDMKEMKKLVKKIDTDNLRIVGLISANGIILEKRGISYEEVGKILDKWILENFDVGK